MKSPPVRPAPVLLLLAALAVGACGDDAPGPEPGFVTVTLVSPNGAEGGAVLRVEGETVTRADTDEGILFVRQVDLGSRLVVVRSAPGTIRFRMEVPDVHRPPELIVEQVSGPDDALRASVAGYTVEVAG